MGRAHGRARRPPDVAYVLVFENRGPEVGATITHPHGQIYAFDDVPELPLRGCDRAGTVRDPGGRLVRARRLARLGAIGARRSLRADVRPTSRSRTCRRWTTRPQRPGRGARRRARPARPPLRAADAVHAVDPSAPVRRRRLAGRPCTWRSSRRGGRPAWRATSPRASSAPGLLQPGRPRGRRAGAAGGAVRRSSLLLSGRPWEQPELTGRGRVPPSATLRRAGASRSMAAGSSSCCRARTRRSASGRRSRCPGLWTMQGFAPPQYTNVQMPFASAPDRARGQPDRRLPAPLRGRPGRTAASCCTSAASEGAVRHAQRRAGGDRQGRQHASRVRRHRRCSRPRTSSSAAVVQWSDASFVEDQDHWWHAGLPRSVFLTRRRATTRRRFARGDIADGGLVDGRCRRPRAARRPRGRPCSTSRWPRAASGPRWPRPAVVGRAAGPLPAVVGARRRRGVGPGGLPRVAIAGRAAPVNGAGSASAASTATTTTTAAVAPSRASSWSATRADEAFNFNAVRTSTTRTIRTGSTCATGSAST